LQGKENGPRPTPRDDGGAATALVGEAIRAGLADTGRLGLFGLSHGGFATGWLVATSGRFKAGMADGLTGRPCGR
jgi:dipeptidyl aminopeptidase/acylaminoacyl peptidase